MAASGHLPYGVVLKIRSQSSKMSLNVSTVMEYPLGEQALSLLGGLIGYIASLLDEHGGSSAAQRFLERRVKELEDTLEEQKLIEKAKGILMERLKLTEPEAMRRLQKESQGQNKRLAQIAHIIVQAGKII